MRPDALTGSDINESSLGQVPSANSANSANTANTANSANSANSAGSADSAGGVTPKAFNYFTDAANDPASEIYNHDGLLLSAGCAGNTLVFTASTSTLARP